MSYYVIIHSYLILSWCRERLASWRTKTTPNQTFRCLMRTLIPLTAVRLSRMLLLTKDAALVVNCAKTIEVMLRGCFLGQLPQFIYFLFQARLQREARSEGCTLTQTLPACTAWAWCRPELQTGQQTHRSLWLQLITVVKTNRRRACVQLWPCSCCCCAEAQQSIAGRISLKISHMYFGKLYLAMLAEENFHFLTAGGRLVTFS